MSSAASAVNSANAQVTSTQSRMLSGSTSTGNRTVDGNAFTDSMTHSQGKQDVWAAQTAQNIARGITNNSTEQQAITNALTGALGASLQAGGEVPIIGGGEIKAALNEQLHSTGGVTEERAKTLSNQASEQYSKLTNNSDAYAHMKNYASSHGDESVFSSEQMRQKAEQWASALSSQVTANEQFTKMASLEHAANMARPVKAEELGYALAKFDNGETNRAYIELMLGDPKVAEALTAAKIKAADGIRAAGITLPGDQFDLATKFLAINSVRPDKGVEIARNTVIPFEQGLDTGLKHDTFKTGLKPGDIVQPEDAKAVQHKAGGKGDVTTLWGSGGMGGSGQTGGSMPGSQQPSAAGNADTVPTISDQQHGDNKAGVSGTSMVPAMETRSTGVSGKDGQPSTTPVKAEPAPIKSSGQQPGDGKTGPSSAGRADATTAGPAGKPSENGPIVPQSPATGAGSAAPKGVPNPPATSTDGASGKGTPHRPTTTKPDIWAQLDKLTSIHQPPAKSTDGGSSDGVVKVSAIGASHASSSDIQQTSASGKSQASSNDGKLSAKLGENGFVRVADDHKGPAKLKDKVDAVTGTDNAAGHGAPKAPSSWGDIIKNNVGKIPGSPVKDLHVPSADDVKELNENRSLGQSAVDHYDKMGGGREWNIHKFEKALDKDASVLVHHGWDSLKDGLGLDKAKGKLEDLGGAVREKIMPPADHKE
jgi:hypothetical protein